MKYWLFEHNKITGPYAPQELAGRPAFSPDSLVCQEDHGGSHKDDWIEAASIPELSSTASGMRAAIPARDEELLEKISRIEAVLSRLHEEENRRDKELAQLRLDLDARTKEAARLAAQWEEFERRARSLAAPGEKVVEAALEATRKSAEMAGEIARLKDKLQAVETAAVHGAFRAAALSPAAPAPAPAALPTSTGPSSKMILAWLAAAALGGALAALIFRPWAAKAPASPPAPVSAPPAAATPQAPPAAKAQSPMVVPSTPPTERKVYGRRPPRRKPAAAASKPPARPQPAPAPAPAQTKPAGSDPELDQLLLPGMGKAPVQAHPRQAAPAPAAPAKPDPVSDPLLDELLKR